MEQEIFAFGGNIKHALRFPETNDAHSLQHFYTTHSEESDYALIFNFLYGDAASESLGMKKYGVPGGFSGYKFAQW